MLEICIVDLTGDSRARLADELSLTLSRIAARHLAATQVSILPIAPEEIRFRGNPFLCILGASLIDLGPEMVGAIHRAYPLAALVAELPQGDDNPELFDQLLRLGVTETFVGQIPSLTILKYLRNALTSGRVTTGKIIGFDAGKGGIGTTSLTASFGAVLAQSGTRTIALDLDHSSRDLSRFLQVRPLISESLEAILSEQTPLTAESIAHCLCVVPGWDDLLVVPPTATDACLRSVNPRIKGIFADFLAALPGHGGCLLIDIATLGSEQAASLYPILDGLMFILDNDPCCLPASVERFKALAPYLSNSASIYILVNNSRGIAFEANLVANEFISHCGLSTPPTYTLPFDRHGSLWAGMGSYLFATSKSPALRTLHQLAFKLGLTAAPPTTRSYHPRRLATEVMLQLKHLITRKPQPAVTSKLRLQDQEACSTTGSTELLKLPNLDSAQRFLAKEKAITDA